jgi:hypothetical protein
MNINDYWDEVEHILSEDSTLAESNLDSWSYLWSLRKKTWTGFAEIEAKKGIVAPKISLSTSHGQEVTRVLLFRILEEASEALLAEERPHLLEELIDAVNYLMSMFLIDDERPEDDWQLNVLFDTAVQQVDWDSELSIEDLGEITIMLGGVLSDKLRNRAWMNHSQDFYFSGRKLFQTILTETFARLLSPFKNFEEFMKYFIAKDMVLQFRLRSNY